MVARKKRTAVVLDTNVFVRHYRSPNKNSPNRQVVRLWRHQKRLQLIICPEILGEYVETFIRVLGMEHDQAARWRTHLENDSRCTRVNLARRFTESRDPDDNVFLATAVAGKAEYLITNDRDLLDLPAAFKKTLPFAIVTPRQFLAHWTGS